MVPFVIRAVGAALALFLARSRRAQSNGARRRLPAWAAQTGAAGQRAQTDACRLAERAGARRLVDAQASTDDSRSPSGLRLAERRARVRVCQRGLAFAPAGPRAAARRFS